MAKWESQILRWRSELKISKQYSPWNDLGNSATGIKLTPRVRQILNMVVAEKIKSLGAKHRTRDRVLARIKGTVVDISQNPGRKNFTKDEKAMRALTTSSQLYHFGRDCCILPSEMLALQGHNPDRFKVPPSMTPIQVRRLAGEGMALPCLGMIVVSLCLTKGFPEP